MPYDLAALLQDLKERSGLSYTELARLTFTSSSTLHRYCSGEGAPPDYESARRIAESCGALPEDLDELLLRWRTAVAGGPNGSVRDGDPGARWERAPEPIDPARFGITMNSTTGKMPSFRIGSIRLWDSDTRWANVEPQRSHLDWQVLDRLVDGAERAGLPVLFVFGGTPGWAAPEGRKSVYPDGARAAPPDDLADWDAFVTAVATRYRGRIEAYELWVNAVDHRFYLGELETLVEMTRRAAEIIRRADPAAILVAPAMGRLWDPSSHRLLERFTELGGYQHCDVASLKLHQHHASDPPETMARLLAAVDLTLHRAGIHPHLWNTGSAYELPLQGTLPPEQARDYAVRFFLMSLYGREFGLQRMYFYTWGNGRIPLVLEVEGSPPTPAARAVQRLQEWLDGKLLRAVGYGRAAGLPHKVWECLLEATSDGAVDGDANRDGDANGDGTGTGSTRQVIRWSESGTAEVPAPDWAGTVHRLDGIREPVRPGAPMRITGEPVLITPPEQPR